MHSFKTLIAIFYCSFFELDYLLFSLNADCDNDDDVDFTVLALRDIEEMENKIEKRRE
jgi:hypothetical protein